MLTKQQVVDAAEKGLDVTIPAATFLSLLNWIENMTGLRLDDLPRLKEGDAAINLMKELEELG